MSVINKSPVNILEEPMFLGSDLGVARFDMQKHRIFEQLTEKQLSFFWRPEEVDLTADEIQFKKMLPFEQNIFINNLKYQTLLDTLQGSAPSKVFGPIISDGSLATWVETWTFSETIHSRSYTHIIRNVFSNPSEIFDSIIKDEAIIKRADAIGRYYDELDEAIVKYRSLSISGNEADKEDVLRKLYRCMHSVNALEAIRFYVSFSCSFAFMEHMRVMEGNSKIIKLIARDEQLHLKGTQYILKNIQNGGEGELFQRIAKEEEAYCVNIFLEVLEQELDWIDYIYKDGEITGLPKSDLVGYLYYLLISRMNGCGLPVPEDKQELAPKHHPIPWIRSYLNSDEVQVAPQEVEISSYLISQIDNDLVDEHLDGYKKYL